MAGVSRAINYLHCHDSRGPAFHRDIKSANIVLDLGLSPKLIDCGLSKFIPNQHSHGTIMSTTGAALGTPGYMCSTYVRKSKFEAKSEIFSFGIVNLELLTGRLTMPNLDGNDLYEIYIGTQPQADRLRALQVHPQPAQSWHNYEHNRGCAGNAWLHVFDICA